MDIGVRDIGKKNQYFAFKLGPVCFTPWNLGKVSKDNIILNYIKRMQKSIIQLTKQLKYDKALNGADKFAQFIRLAFMKSLHQT